jgi:hypothetical protein
MRACCVCILCVYVVCAYYACMLCVHLMRACYACILCVHLMCASCVCILCILCVHLVCASYVCILCVHVVCGCCVCMSCGTGHVFVLGTSKRLFKRPRPSVDWSIHWSVRPHISLNAFLLSVCGFGSDLVENFMTILSFSSSSSF